MAATSPLDQTTLIVSIRGQKIEIHFEPNLSVEDVKELVGRQFDMPANDVKLMLKGKVLSDPNDNIQELLQKSSKSGKLSRTYRLMAVGLSRAEVVQNQESFELQKQRAPRVRDNISNEGKLREMDRKRKGQLMLQQAIARGKDSSPPKYGFGTIETLPGLPDKERAKEILSSLANDPGVLACMAKHKWNVGSLSELYPEGKVGESAVCVMGLNENKGQRIKLRIRTDDLKGFRKPLSIRKVLFHELAHNVHSEHNGDFFLLMRQIEKECNEMDWTKGAGLESSPQLTSNSYEGGAFRLGDGQNRQTGGSHATQSMAPSELRYHAALQRMTPEKVEIEHNCGCGQEATNLFLPISLQTAPPKESKDDTK